MEIQKEDKILLALIDDRKEQCEERYMISHTAFLDLRQRALAEGKCKSDKGLRLLSEMEIQGSGHTGAAGRIRCFFEGGYPDAERRILVFLPDYGEAPGAAPIKALRVTCAKGGRPLNHRDYLGSLLNLGIKREMVGDILVYENGADIFILEEIEEFLITNYDRAGRVELSVESIPLSEIRLPEENAEERKDTVASLRLDNVLAAVFDIPRSRAAEAVNSGLVFVNSAAALKTDMQIKEGDKVVLRGKGKAVITEAGGTSRKGRIYITFKKYL